MRLMKKTFTREKKAKPVSKKTRKSFKEWRATHRKQMVVMYYCVAAIIILVNVGIVLDNTITRTETIESEEDISFRTEYEDDDSLELGTEEVKQAGENGLKKVYKEEKKKLITGTVLDSNIAREETIKEPVKEIKKRGTRRWQYMICSDGGWMFYNDEQFKDKNVGFTHASEDVCAKNGKGTAVALADSPSSSNPTVSSYSGSGGNGLTEDYVRAMEIIAERERELRNNETNNTSSPEPFTGSTANGDSFAGERARQEAERQARATAESTCRSQAEQAKDNARRQLGAMGVGGSQLTTVPQEAYDSTYSNCMRGYGY